MNYLERTSRFLFKRDPSNGFLIGPDDCHYETEQEAMYYSLKASCGCGDPSGVHDFLVGCLRQFETDEWPKPGLEGIKKLLLANPDTAAEFIAHYLSSEDFIEHGCSVKGSWITDRGKQFLEVGPMVEASESE